MKVSSPARRKSCGVFYFALLITSWLPIGHSQPAEPYASRDQNPLVAIYGFPLPVNARLLPANESQWRLTLNISNTVNIEETAALQLRVDAETHQLNLLYAYSVSDSWMLRLQGSITQLGAGFLDRWINDYHNLFGLKEGDRPYVDVNQFQIYVRSQSTTLLNLQAPQSGLSDLQIQLGTQLQKTANNATSLWISVKLPSGDSVKLTGSGATDFALWLSTQQQLESNTWLYATLGSLYMSDTDVLPSLHNHNAEFGNLGLSYSYNDWLQLKAQLDVHSTVYNTQLDFLDSAVELTFGGNIKVNAFNEIDLAVSEDIKYGSSPDVTFNISWIWRY